MHPSHRGQAPGVPWLERLLVGLVAGVVLVDVLLFYVTRPPRPLADVLLLFAPLSTGTSAELVRLALAGGAFGAVAVGFVLGAVRRPAYGVGAALSLPVVAVYAYTGLLLPWTELSYYVGQLLLEATLSIPVFGELLAEALFGGFTLGRATLRTAFRYHYTIVGGVGIVSALAFVLRNRGPVAIAASPEE